MIAPKPEPLPLTAQQCRAARKALGLSQLQLGLEVGCDPDTIVAIETNKRPVRVATRLRLRTALERLGVAFGPGEEAALRCGAEGKG